MRIDKLILKNYRCFADLTVEFHPQMTVLVALNGGGKTAILDAVKVALWPFVAGFDLGSTTNDVTGIQIDDVQVQKANKEMEPCLPSELRAYGKATVARLVSDDELPNLNVPTGSDGIDIYFDGVKWSSQRYREKIKKGTKTKDAKPVDAINLGSIAVALQKRIFSVDQNIPDMLPMLGYYGTGRLWAQKRQIALNDDENKNEIQSRTFAYRDCMDSTSSYKHFATWFKHIQYAYFQARMRNLSREFPLDADVPYSQIAPVRAVQKAVDGILKRTGWHRLEFGIDARELVLSHAQHGELKVSQLSDGIRNMLALAGDIAYRCYKLNAHFGERAVTQTEGIVLIDEVDMHLHPSWQQTVLSDLMAAFPKLQFIVTTHSPQVLSTVHRDNIRVIGENVLGNLIAQPPLAEAYGLPSGDVLQSVMHVDPQPPVPEQQDLLRLTELVDQGQYGKTDATKLMGTLTAKLGATHPQLQRLQRSIQRQKTLSS